MTEAAEATPRWRALVADRDELYVKADDISKRIDQARCPAEMVFAYGRCALDRGHGGDHRPEEAFTWRILEDSVAK